MLRYLGLLLATLMLSGCAAAVKEHHYFASYRKDAAGRDRPVNFFRLNVAGTAGFSNARYLAGYYDERAIDLFFNEMKAPTNQKLFQEDAKIPGTDEKLKPLGATSGNGAFVLIMSTNADSVANAIGSFAESQVVAQALTQLINKDKFKEKSRSDVDVISKSAQASSMIKRLDLHLGAAKTATSPDLARRSYTKALYTLAQSLGYRGAEFSSYAEARKWFDAELDQSRAMQ